MDNFILNFGKYMLNEATEFSDFPLFISDDLKKVLHKIITDPIASKILSGKNPSDISFIDIDKDSKNVTYFPLDRLNRLVPEDKISSFIEHMKSIWPNNIGTDDYFASKFRQNTGWGKVINKLFPGEFDALAIDRFYNRYRPEIDVKSKDRFKLVRGEDIRHWYLNTRWDGKLGSCMQHEGNQPYFDIYCHNPEKCGLLIYFSDKNPDKIIGRALVWNNLLKPSGDTAEDKNPYWLLDRVYYVDGQGSQIEAAFQKYAIDHGWMYKHGDGFYVNGVRKTTSVATRLKPIDHKYYPYVDTMCYYTPTTGRAASTPGNPARDPNNPSKVFPRYSLKSQSGGKSNV